MMNILKWILVVGAILSGLLLMGMLIFNTSWVGQFIIPFGHGTTSAGNHSIFGSWTSYGGLTFGVLYFLSIIGGLFLVIRSQPQRVPDSGVKPDPLGICPACAVDLEPNWDHCPSCGYDLS